MATYDYRCPSCGTFEQRATMGTAAPVTTCPTCGQDARRVFSPPLTSRTPQPLAAALAREEASRDAPEVVHRVPPKAGPPPRPRHPAQARLPRR
jgi:putative FmdB family regulatory protein